MSEERYLVLFPGDTGGWLRMTASGFDARGESWDTVRPLEDDQENETVVLVLSGADVAVHWMDLPGNLSIAQAKGAARILAGEVSAEPLDNMHIALGPAAEGEEERCMALVAKLVVERALEDVAAIGLEVDSILPEPLLVAPPEDGARIFRRGGLDNVRCPRRAFAAEADLAALLLEDEPLEVINASAFESGLAQAIAAAPVDLRQGEFAKRRRWKLDAGYVRRMAMLAGAILLVTLAIQLTLIMRYSFAADSVERETANIARDALPGVVEINDPRVQLRERLTGLGGGPGYSGISAPIFSAVREISGAELQSLVYSSTDGAQISVAVPTEQDAAMFQQQLSDAGLAVTPGQVRNSGGRRIADYVVKAQ